METGKPQLSIIIPALNEEKYLPTLLTDLSRQTYRDFEVIIVDGQSSDKTVQKADLFAHRLPRLTILSSTQKNVSYQRNLGAASATADLLLFMDADNRLPIYFLQGLKYRLDITQPDIFTTWIAAENDDSGNSAIATVINLYFDLQKSTANPPTIESMLGFRKSLFTKLKGFNPKLAINEGNDIVKKALKKRARFELFKDPTYIYSLRRLRKQGSLRLLGNVAQLEVARLLGQKVARSKITKLYPMQGGNFFDIEKNALNFFDSLSQKLKIQKRRDKLVSFARSLLFVDDDSGSKN